MDGRFGQRRALALGVVVGGILGLGLWACSGDAPPAAPAPPGPRRASGPPPAVVPSGPHTPAQPAAGADAQDVARLLRDAPLAPSFHAPGLGLDVDAGAKVDVAVTGQATLFEVDLADGPIPLRRARALDAAPPAAATGLFGRGWRSELESRVLAAGEGALVLRLQGATPFVPLEGDVLVSLAGEVELLRRAPDGWELAAADGRVLTFDAQGQLARLEPGFAVERAPGRVVLTDAQGAQVVLRLDAAGRVAQIDDGGGPALTLRHDPTTGELLALGARRYEVDARGRLVRAGGLQAAFDARGRVARLACSDPSRAQTYAFAAGRAEATTPEGRFTYTQVDDGFVVDTPRGEDRAWLDARGRLVAFRRAGEETRLLARDALEQPLLAPDGVDDAGPVGPAADDADDDVARALGLAVTRDDAGRLTQVLTPAGRRWTFGWEARRLVATDGPAGPVALTRDARGRLTSRRDASGRELFHELDAHGRPLSVAARTGEQVVWTREDDGRLRSIAAHDAAGRAARLDLHHDPRTGAVTTVAQPGDVALRYQAAPGRDEVLTPWGRFVTTYDAQGQPATLDTPAGAFAFVHDEQGRRVETTYPGGLVVERQRDEAGRVRRQVARRGARVVSTLDVARDAQGQRTRATRDGVVTRYEHDARGRLTRLERRGRETTRVAAWAWNDDADRTAEARGDEHLRLRHDARGRLVSRAGAGRVERFVHDEAGRLVERVRETVVNVNADGADGDGGDGAAPAVVGRDRLEYDGFGRLTRVARAGRPVVDYTYDPLGRRLTRTVAGETTRFVHDGERLLAEVGPGQRRRVYVWGPGGDEPLAWCERARADAPWRWRFVVSSDLHTSLTHVDEEGRVVAHDDLDPWGAGDVASDRPVFFAGHLVDATTGLVPMRARWYDPSLGRFLTPDPAGLAAGPNAYAYVSGRPLDLVDPLGLQEAAPEEPPGLFTRFGRWVGDKAAGTRDSVVGAAEGLAYLTGLRGTASERAAARSASWDDLASGRAQSRALGAVDGYVQGVTFGLVDPNYSRFAHDPDQARAGRGFGADGALAFGLISGRAAISQGLRGGAAGLVNGARALPGAVRALPGAVRALPGAAGRGVTALGQGARALPGLAARGLRAAPGLARDGLGWVAANRGALARGVGRALGEQARGAYRVTVGPFVNLGKALLRPVHTAREAGRGLARLPRALRDTLRTGRTGRTAAPVAPAGRAAGAGAATLADDALALARGADDAARAAADDVARATASGPTATADDLARGAEDLVAGQGARGAQAGHTAPRGSQDGIVQALGGPPPSASARAPRPGQGSASSPRAPPGRPASSGRPATPAPPAPPARLNVVVGEAGATAVDPRTGRAVGSGSLTNDGLLTLYVNVPAAGLPQGRGYGREAIVGIHEALVAGGRDVRGIEACWMNMDDIADNLRAFEDALGSGLSVEQAALATPTGRAAQVLGYGRVQPGSYAPIPGEDGGLACVALTFVE